MKIGGRSGGSLGGGFIEHHDLCFFVVDAHTTSLCPVLEASIIDWSCAGDLAMSTMSST